MVAKIINYTFLNFFIPCFNHKTSDLSYCNTSSGQSAFDVPRGTDSTEKMGKMLILGY